MGIKDLIIKGIRSPHRIPFYIKNRSGYGFNILIRKKVPFTYEDVISNWGIKGRRLPQFSARLYKEVKLLNVAIGSHHAKKSLEIGCGYGRLTPWIAEHSDKHYAIEIESVLLEDARRLYPDVYFRQAKAQELPFPDCHFDLCVSWTVLQHIPPKQLIKAVAEMKRVCAPEAVIILAEGVGEKTKKGPLERTFSGYWEHTVEEWMNLLLPWKLTWFTDRKIERTFKGFAGLVMRFERRS